jgi:hypothetical protein
METKATLAPAERGRAAAARCVTVLLLALAATGPAAAQGSATPAPAPLREAPPEIDRSRPGGDPAEQPRDRSGGGPTGDDIQGDNEGGGIARGVVPPPAGVDPGIQGSVPNPTPGTTPIIPPPGAPGSDSNLEPR